MPLLSIVSRQGSDQLGCGQSVMVYCTYRVVRRNRHKCDSRAPWSGRESCVQDNNNGREGTTRDWETLM